MTDSYYYLLSSLPWLAPDEASPIGWDQFIEYCNGQLTVENYDYIVQLPRLVQQFDSPGSPDAAEPYDFVMQQSHSTVIHRLLLRWWEHERGLRRTLAELRSNALGWNNIIFTGYPTSDSFYSVDAARTAVAAESPLEGEMELYRLRWRFLDRLGANHFFRSNLRSYLWLAVTTASSAADAQRSCCRTAALRTHLYQSASTHATESNFMKETGGTVVGVNGSLVTVRVDAAVALNEVGYILLEEKRLKSEVIRIRGDLAEMQVFESTRGLSIGDTVSFSGELLSVELGPGLLGKIFDGLQNPLPELARDCGFFLQRGIYLSALDTNSLWAFTPTAAVGDRCRAGDQLGYVPEGIFRHRIMVPFHLSGEFTLQQLAAAGDYPVNHEIAQLQDSDNQSHTVSMRFNWPVKQPIALYQERLQPTEPMVTKIRIIDTFIPVALGGTYCIPGPFGAGKTVLQQITSRNAAVDIVIIAACGERAGEVVETLKEFPELTDPRTGRTLMERTVIVVNTSSMPVAAREASVYTAATIAEYYRQMGLHVLLLADSTSRWAQAMREMSGRLEEIPGEEAFPAYLGSVIASFYERAGVVRLYDGGLGSVTIGGTVSPAGGNFEEPVTQATLKVVGAFHGLSRERSDARKYPAIHPLESWSKYPGIANREQIAYAHSTLVRGDEIGQMMKVVGEEGVSMDDFQIYLKAELLDQVFLQQNAFDPVDSSTSPERQRHALQMLIDILQRDFTVESKDSAQRLFALFRQQFLDWNGADWNLISASPLNAPSER